MEPGSVLDGPRTSSWQSGAVFLVFLESEMHVWQQVLLADGCKNLNAVMLIYLVCIVS